jgi:hypothetical protein
MASGQEPVPPSVFAGDQLKPSVRYMELEGVGIDPATLGTGADPLPSGADPESAPNVFVLTEVDEGPTAEPNPQLIGGRHTSTAFSMKCSPPIK